MAETKPLESVPSSKSAIILVYSNSIEKWPPYNPIAEEHPIDVKHIKTRMNEQFRLLEWAELVQLDQSAENLSIRRQSTKKQLFKVLIQTYRLLHHFGLPEKAGNQSTRPFLIVEVAPDVLAAKSANNAAFKVDNLKSLLQSSAELDMQQERKETLPKLSLEYARMQKGSPTRLGWVTFDKDQTHHLEKKLAVFNQIIRDILNQARSRDKSLLRTETPPPDEFNESQSPVETQKTWGITQEHYEQRETSSDRYFERYDSGTAFYDRGKIHDGRDSGALMRSVLHKSTDDQRKNSNSFDNTTEVDSSRVDQGSDEPLGSNISAHLLSDQKDVLSQLPWKDIVQLLPEGLRLGLQYDNLDPGPCWTFTPNAAFTPTLIPLTIAGVPVVIPLKYRYPVHAPTGVPPDPCPSRINPSGTIEVSTIDQIFGTFGDILGFYILINGFLQLLIPEDYELEEALQRYPSRFGGLKVSYVPFSVLSTGSTSEAPITESSSSKCLAKSFRMSFGLVKRYSRKSKHPSIIHQLEFSSTLRARVLKQRSPSWFGGKPGVLTRKGSGQFMTFPTHVATKALEEAKHTFVPNENWIDKVEVYDGDLKVGNVCQTFDPFASELFPDGLLHDVSLIDVRNQQALSLDGLRSPEQCTWLTNEECISMRLTKTRIALLRKKSTRSKTIALSESHEQLVGQGIFKNIQDSRTRSEVKKARSRGEVPTEQISKWSSFVSRAILYRVDPDFDEPRSNSGTALCVIDENTGVHKVAGFQSFVQEVDRGQYYELEEDPFLDMLRLGTVAFYGAFEIPNELREQHEIVTEE